MKLTKKVTSGSMSAERIHTRPLCGCCGGGERRKGYTCTKAKSHRKSAKARKPRYKDKHVAAFQGAWWL